MRKPDFRLPRQNSETDPAVVDGLFCVAGQNFISRTLRLKNHDGFTDFGQVIRFVFEFDLAVLEGARDFLLLTQSNKQWN